MSNPFRCKDTRRLECAALRRLCGDGFLRIDTKIVGSAQSVDYCLICGQFAPQLVHTLRKPSFLLRLCFACSASSSLSRRIWARSSTLLLTAP